MNQKISVMFFVSVLLFGCGGVKSKPSQVSGSILKAPVTLADIPAFCKDPRGKYKPVKRILSKGSYHSKPKFYQPIQGPKGFIVTDFNHDKVFDLVFLERSGTDIRLISCVSSRAGNIRKPTPFKVHETIKPDFQTISETIQYKAGKLVLTVNKHEHNWGSDSETNRYAYNNKTQDFVLERQEKISSSGDGMRSDTEAFYDLVSNRYKRSNVCGSMEEGCKPQKSSGRIVPHKPRSTLHKPAKVYGRLIPD